MPVKQRQRIKRRTFAKLRIKRKKQSSELIDTIDGNPIFTEDDIEDDRIIKLLQQKRSSNYDDDEKDIFLTDLLDIDSDNDNNNDNDDKEHTQMLEDIFGSQSVQEATIMGSQLNADPLDIQANVADLQSLMRNKKNKRISMNLSQKLDALDDQIIQHERVTMNEMISTLNVPLAKSARKQITQFDENQELERLKLAAQTKVNNLNVVRKERGLQMDKTRKEMQSWSEAVRNKTEELKNKRNMIPPKNNMMSFMENMEWNGDLGKELQCILDDYSAENDLDKNLSRHKPSKEEIIKQSKKMSDMRRQISNQIKQFKRVKKIKSKSFRKRMRARKAKVEPSLEELKELDPRLYKREVNKLIRQRAIERMTLRHKNSSKWAINIIRRGKTGKIDLKSRKALMEQLERGKSLKRKIQGRNSDSDTDDDINPNKFDQNPKNDKNEFETEVESETKKKEKYISDAKEKGIWNMKFMKSAEDKRRENIRLLTNSAEKAKSFGELDSLEREVNKIERSAYNVNRLINSSDDPIGAIKHSNWLNRQNINKKEAINIAQTILGKRKYGEMDDENNNNNNNNTKKMKHRILDVGDKKTKLINGTQNIEESVFGAGSKSIIRIDINNENNNNNKLKEKEINEPIFEMIEFAKHDNKKMSISEKNKIMSGSVNKKDLNNKFGFNKKIKIKTQRYYVDNNDRKYENENENNNNNSDGWSVILKENESVHNVKFGTLYLKENNNNNNINVNVNENLNGFLDESDDTQSESENENDNINDKNVIKSILKDSKYESIGKNDKHVKFGKNEYSDGNVKNNNNKNNKNNKKIENNPWLFDLNNKNNNNNNKKQEILLIKQKETTQFDANKMLIPDKLRKVPDFNLLQTNDKKQIDIIYKSLQNNNNAQLMDIDTNEQEFNKLKENVIYKQMPNKFEGPLKGWDNWTGPGIINDLSYIDNEYLEAKALYAKKKQKLFENRSDSGLANVILSDQISKASSKYVMKWQPEWVNISAYNQKMNDTIGREWNLATEYFNVIKPDYDIPNGYIIEPTKKYNDKNDNTMNYKTKFGKKNNNKTTKLHSIYKSNANITNTKKITNVDDRPQRDKA